MFNTPNIVEESLKRLVVDTDKEISQVIQASVKRAMEDECPCCCSCMCNVKLSWKTKRAIRQTEKMIARGEFSKFAHFTLDELITELEK